ncbi:MAG: DUF983 domain-containing protein [Rhizobiales bacterium]|nr:DUF983 domain-containing protein [Hyphomicrobiales bacterium]
MIEFDTPTPPAEELPRRDIKMALLRGWRQTCPACGTGALYHKFLKVSDTCPACAEELHHQRADDAPPYFTMVIVGHVVIAGVLLLERNIAPPTWVHMALWLPLTVGLSLWLLPRVKGALVGLQWALRMHGFGGATDDPVPDPPTR